MPPVSLLVKPASSLCNLRCKYCFYHSIAEGRTTESFGIMSRETLELLVKRALEFAEHSCTFAFQGGEPTLAGLDFYRTLVNLQKNYNTKKVQLHNAIQTNGLAIDEAWAEFLAKNDFLVGISLDGTKDIHDLNRYDAASRGSFAKVMHAVDLFNRYGVKYNILTVINSATARHIAKIYGFFKKNNFRYLQFIPCLDPLDEKPGGHEYSLTPEKYANFLKTLFDLWYEDIIKGNMISVRYFDNLVGMAMGYPPESCGMSGSCASYFTVEADGGVYPCDFYVVDEWRMGSIAEQELDALVNSVNGRRFIETSEYTDPGCRECEYFRLCRGGCRRNREPFADGRPVLNYYCPAFKEFFSYASERLYKLAGMFMRRNGI